jgi:hypothetical protein
MFEFSVSKDMIIIIILLLIIIAKGERSASRKVGANPKIASPVTSMLHKKGGGSREGNG